MTETPQNPGSGPEQNAERGPAILRQSFRPFFLLAGVWGTLGVLLWMGSLAGWPVLPGVADALAWHKHEMIFGFAAAAMAGFILTAIPNWTGRPPISGWRLAVLVGLWGLGRLAFLLSDWLGPWAVAALDLSFPLGLVAAITRELIAGKNKRNFPILGLIALFQAGDLLVHLGRLEIADTTDSGYRLSIFILAMLIALIGGRIVPNFTRNWLKKKGAEKLPPEPGRVDHAALAVLALLVIAEVVAPEGRITAYIAIAAGLLHAWRLARWKGLSVLSEPLLWVLHLGYAWLAAALVLLGLAGLGDVLPDSAALHALTAGAFGTMILAIAIRASLGHTGRPLKAGAGTRAVFLLITVAAAMRVVSPLLGDFGLAALWISGGAWTLACGLFTVLYFPVFTKPAEINS